MADCCIRCGLPGTSRCGRCRAVSYCGAACQKAHWTSGHKGQCKVLSATPDSQQFIQVAAPSPAAASRARDANQGGMFGRGHRDGVAVADYLFPPKRVAQLLRYRWLNSMGTAGPLGLVGFQNCGNSCYLNSCLQALIHLVPLANFLLGDDHSPKSCIVSPDFCMLCRLKELASLVLMTSDDGIFFPRNIYMGIRQMGDFRMFQQEDAHEYLIAVLQALQRTFMLHAPGKPDPRLEETTFIFQLFGGLMQSQIKCCQCSQVSTSFESFLDLSLELSSGESIEEALQTYTSIENMDESVGWRCGKCAKAVAAEKQLTLYQAPNVLLINLKRFDLMRGGGKINKSVAFRDRVDVQRYMSRYAERDESSSYELAAVVVHYGSTVFSGHYVAFVKILGTWFLFDDDKVQEVDLSTVLKQNAYLLFYQKQLDPDPKATAAPAPASTGRKKATKRESTDEELKISTTSQASLTLDVAEPKYAVFYTEDADATIKSIVIRVSVPLLSSVGDAVVDAVVEVRAGGLLHFAAANAYRLDLPLPFAIDAAAVSAKHYPADRVLLITAPVVQQAGSQSAPTPVRIEAVRDVFDLAALGVDLANELTVSSAAAAGAAPTGDAPASTAAAAKKKPPKPAAADSNVEQSTYAKLYSEIRSAQGRQQQPTQSTSVPVRGTGRPATTAKAGRNEDCSCGSGKKYKKCHGRAR
eukprot:TRINITY_DN5164_c0_g1_i1.p1 TRINITY_DN5164_c0_g1~~TRINITY_DN5164_c0_g1_i1.p1  ORF type:complete len:696 (+),score=245.49 TRINITY_DN5164_c0_g1_i1:112-2199(+)